MVAGVKALVKKRRYDLDSLSIGWFGGEPLLAKDAILDLSEHCQRVGKTRFRFSASITTNASLLDSRTAKLLIKSGVRFFQITLDGDREAHNQVRTDYHGHGSFDQIWENLRQLRALSGQFLVTLRIHLSPSNFDSCQALCSKLVVEFGKDPRFKVYAKGLKHLGGKHDKMLAILSDEEERRRIECLHAHLREVGMLYLPYYQEKEMCYAAMANSFVIRANGDVQKCTVALDSDFNTIGKLTRDGELELDQAKTRAWLGWLDNPNSNVAAACPLTLFSSQQRRNNVIEVKSLNSRLQEPRAKLMREDCCAEATSPLGDA